MNSHTTATKYTPSYQLGFSDAKRYGMPRDLRDFPDGTLQSEYDAGYAAASGYRKGTLEARLDQLLPAWEAFDVIAHELWRDDGGGWSVNDSWHLARSCDRAEAISHLRNRWEVFKVNYHAKAKVKDLEDANWSGDEYPSLLEVDCIPFAEIRKGGE